MVDKHYMHEEYVDIFLSILHKNKFPSDNPVYSCTNINITNIFFQLGVSRFDNVNVNDTNLYSTYAFVSN